MADVTVVGGGLAGVEAAWQAARAGAAVILARRNHTRYAQLSAAMLNLTQTNVNVIGSVINDH